MHAQFWSVFSKSTTGPNFILDTTIPNFCNPIAFDGYHPKSIIWSKECLIFTWSFSKKGTTIFPAFVFLLSKHLFICLHFHVLPTETLNSSTFSRIIYVKLSNMFFFIDMATDFKGDNTKPNYREFLWSPEKNGDHMLVKWLFERKLNFYPFVITYNKESFWGPKCDRKMNWTQVNKWKCLRTMDKNFPFITIFMKMLMTWCASLIYGMGLALHHGQKVWALPCSF